MLCEGLSLAALPGRGYVPRVLVSHSVPMTLPWWLWSETFLHVESKALIPILRIRKQPWIFRVRSEVTHLISWGSAHSLSQLKFCSPYLETGSIQLPWLIRAMIHIHTNFSLKGILLYPSWCPLLIQMNIFFSEFDWLLFGIAILSLCNISLLFYHLPWLVRGSQAVLHNLD